MTTPTRFHACSTTAADGGSMEASVFTCHACGGSGDTPMVYFDYPVPCYVCKGSGTVADCSICASSTHGCEDCPDIESIAA